MMLVLTRKEGESIDIDGGFAHGGITIMVVHIGGNGLVRIGIEAHKEHPIHRREIQERIEREEGGDAANVGD